MKLTIGKKLIAGFMGVALLTLALGVFAESRMSALNSKAVEVGEVWLPSVEHLAMLRAQFNRMRAQQIRYFAQFDDKQDLAVAEQRLNDTVKAIEEARKKYEPTITSPEERKIYDAFVAKYQETQAQHKRMTDLLNQGKKQEAYDGLFGEASKTYDEAIALLREDTELNSAGAAKAVKESAETYSSARNMILVALFTVLALSVGIGLWLARSISRRVIEVAGRVEMLRSVCITGVGQGMEAMGAGDLSYKVVPKTELLAVTSKDELGDLATSVNGIITQTKETIKTFEAMQGTLKTLLVEDGGAALDTAAQRDLTRRVEQHYEGVYDQLKGNINRVLDSLDEALSQVASSAEQVSSASSQISSGAESLAQGTSEQASSIEEVSSSLQEMASMAKQNVGNAKEARSLAEGARSSAERGAANMQNLSEAINKIKVSADSTARIVKTIDEIAFQTNLLALNAAVEAARAGDAGKGFAVVAEEVRNLAMRSAESAKNTAELIEESVKNADNGVALNEGVAATLREINEQVQKVSEMMAEVAAASEQQNQGVDQINSAVEQMNQVTQQAAANAEESASAAEELSGQAEELLGMVNAFTLTNGSASVRRPAAQTKRPAAKRPAATAKARQAAPQVAYAGNGNGNGNGHGHADASKLIPFDADDADVLSDF
jgi:methyl-accepting chemotaxis protein